MAAAALPIVLGLMDEVPTIVSGVTGIVHAVESLFGKGNGTAKKAAALSALSSAIAIYDGTAPVISNKAPLVQSSALAAVSNLIDDVVALSNALGIFQHGAAPAAPA